MKAARILNTIPILIAALLAGTTVRAQLGWSRQQYTSQEGLPQNSVVGMVLDEHGYLWIATQGGLARFDGERMERIPLPSRDGIPAERLHEILPLGPGRFFVRDDHDRRFLIEQGRAVPLTAEAPRPNETTWLRGAPPSEEVLEFLLDQEIPLLLAQDSALETVCVVPLGREQWALCAGQRLILAAGSRLLAEWPMDVPTERVFRSDSTIIGIEENGHAMAIDPRTGRTRPLVLKVEGLRGAFRQVAPMPSWSEGSTTCCLIDGALYALKGNARPDTLFAERMDVELPEGCHLTNVLFDAERGLLLVGTDSKGLFVYRRTYMRTLMCPPDGVRNNTFYAQVSVAEDRVLTTIHGACREFTVEGCITTPPLLERFNYQGIVRDRLGLLWYGVENEVHRSDPRTREDTVLYRSRRMPGHHSGVYCFLEQGDSMWVGTGDGVGVVKDGQFSMVLPIAEQTTATVPICMRWGSDGHLWIATCSGVIRLEPHTGAAQRLPALEGKCVRSMELLGDQLFMGTYGQGAYVHTRGHLFHLPDDIGGHLSHVHAFMPDSAGFLWMSTNRGMLRVLRKEIDAYVADTTKNLFYGYYGTSAGIVNTEFNGGCDPPYVRSANGYASFPSMEGLIWFRPERVPDPFPTGPIHVQFAESDGLALSTDSVIVLASDHHEIFFTFSLAYWGDPSNVQLEYRLEDGAGPWIPFGKGERNLRLQRLPSGEHHLRVRKVGGSLRGDDGAVDVCLSVPPPVYRRWWFLAVAVLAVLGLAYLAMRLNEIRLRRKNQELAQSVRIRTLELEEANARLHRSVEVKDRLVSIISHDLVTPLRFIARVARGVPRSGPEDDVIGTLRDISIAADTLYGNARNLLSWIKHQEGRIELREQHVALASLVEETLSPLREFATSRGDRLLNAVPLDDVVISDRDILGIILQNLVTNALNHTAGSTVTISGEEAAAGYLLTISDDGPGIPRPILDHIHALQRSLGAERPKTRTEEEVPGLGFIIVVELVQVLGAHFQVESNAGQGTHVRIRLPHQQP